MSYIAMNRFKIAEGREADFEDVWRSRESRLKELKGFREFRLLKGPEREGHTLYASHVPRDRKEDIEACTKSEQCSPPRRNHGNDHSKSNIRSPQQTHATQTPTMDT